MLIIVSYGRGARVSMCDPDRSKLLGPPGVENSNFCSNVVKKINNSILAKLSPAHTRGPIENYNPCTIKTFFLVPIYISCITYFWLKLKITTRYYGNNYFVIKALTYLTKMVQMNFS